MHNDVKEMYDVLRRSSYAANEIITLEGQPDRELVLDLFLAARRRIASWQSGSLFLYVSGHGCYTGETAEVAHVAVALAATDDGSCGPAVPWEELWSALDAPPSVTVTLLPDH
jgi:hypothetical protein